MKYDTLLLKCSDSITSLFMPEIQEGIYIPSNEGETIYSFLTGHCGLSAEYISQKVKTVMIDGGPADDIFNTGIKDGGVCAVSGAMPGIVGAMMRIGSPYAAMRESITVKPDQTIDTGKEIIYKLKLFNVILSDKGIDFLKRGILIDRKRISRIFIRHGEEIYSDCSEITLNGSLAEKQKVIEYGNDIAGGLVIIKLEIENESKS
jgi:hypothetical protein